MTGVNVAKPLQKPYAVRVPVLHSRQAGQSLTRNWVGFVRIFLFVLAHLC